ncbi:MAG: Crp/Fnr family transcriptional regulator [Roseburia sp.]
MLNQEDLSTLRENLAFWEQLSPAQRELLTASTKRAHFSKGQALHCGENDCIGVLLVKSGSIRAYITSDEGREVTLYRLESGDICILSASCVMQSIDFDVSVDAETDCEVLQISSMGFSRLASENIYVELFSYKMTAERFSDVMWAMQQLLFTSFDKRLASFLLDECAKSGGDTLHITHEQIARYLGSAREVVSRMLNYFSKEGYVSLSRGTITLLDRKGLRKIL